MSQKNARIELKKLFSASHVCSVNTSVEFQVLIGLHDVYVRCVSLTSL